MSKNKFKPNYSMFPGGYLKSVIDANNISQAQLSRNSGLSEKVISKIISGETIITANSALALEQPLGRTAEFWLKAQANYDLFQAKKKRDENRTKTKDIHEYDSYVLSWGTEEEIPKFSKEEFSTLDEAIARAIILNKVGTSCPNNIQDKDGIIFINGKMLFEMMDEKSRTVSCMKAAE